MVLKHILTTAKSEKITDVFSIKNGDEHIHILVLDNNTLIPMDNLTLYDKLKIQYKMADELTEIFKQPSYTPKTLVTSHNIIKIGTWEYDECRKNCVSAPVLMSNNKLYKIDLEVIKNKPNTIYEIQLKELDVLLNKEEITNFYINNNNEFMHTDSHSYIHTVAVETKRGFYVNGCISKHLDSKKRVSVVKTNGFINVKEIYGETPDQLKICIDTMKSNPDSRRIIVSAWNPAQLKSMALPPCHTGFQIIVNKEQRYFDLIWSQRSCDLMLGIPYNIASYAALMHLIELETGYTANKLYGHLSDIHIYTNHYTGAVAQTLRPTHKLPKIITKNFSSIYDWEYTDTIIEDYVSEDKIEFEIAI
ncbi:MAG TPA: thymidylate synthase, partial [bacterium]|nr:thymidylate synthase [bacterium]